MIKSGLARRITGTLVVMCILSVIASTTLMLVITRQQFAGYIDSNSQVIMQQWKPAIEEYYSRYGFTGLQDFLESSTMGRGMGQHRMGMANQMGMRIRNGQRLVVADVSGIVVADTHRMLIGYPADFNSLHFSSSILSVDENKIGSLYVVSPLGSGLVSLENDFLTRLTVNSGILTIVFGLIALVLGLVLGKRISSPLADLSAAIHKLAQGKLDQRLTLQGDHEFVELGRDFNLMAEKLEVAEQNRRRLTADISHELRTPLTLLRGQLEGMHTGSVPLNAENISLLQDEVIRLSRLVKELDNLAMIENQVVLLQRNAFPVADLLERLQPVSIAMQDRDIQFIIEIQPEIKEITADQDRLLQILLNILSNAMRHSGKPGVVRLSIQLKKESLLFAVTDNGAGIPAQDLPSVFERFYRTDDSRNRREGGMGLGLAIAKGYAEAHGGKMWAESKEGFGSTFYFTLPQK